MTKEEKKPEQKKHNTQKRNDEDALCPRGTTCLGEIEAENRRRDYAKEYIS